MIHQKVNGINLNCCIEKLPNILPSSNIVAAKVDLPLPGGPAKISFVDVFKFLLFLYFLSISLNTGLQTNSKLLLVSLIFD